MANVKQVFKNFYVGNELLAKNRKELAFLLSECKKHGFKYKVSRSLNENYRYLVEADEWQQSPKDIFIVSLREVEQWGVYNGEPMYAICGEIAELYNGNSRDEAFKVMQTWNDDLTKLIENHFDCVEGTPGFEKSLKNASLMLFVDEYLETVDGEDIYADELCQIDANSCENAYGEIKLSPIEVEEDLTPAQDEFFKDSIVRRKGKLVPVYHGTSSDFDEFVEESGLIWTTANKEYATEFSLGSGKVKEVYVNLTKPLVIGPTNVPFEEFMSYMIPSNRVVPSEQVKKLADKLNVSVDVLVDIFNSIDESVPKHKRRLFQVVNKPAFRQLVIDAGYDGVVCNEPVLTFGVVNANQLKYVNNENPTTSKKLNESDIEIELTDGKFYPGDILDDYIISNFMEDYSRLGADEALATLQSFIRYNDDYSYLRESVDDIFYRMWFLYDKEDVENKMDDLKEMFFDWASEFFNPGVVAELKDEYFTVGMQFGFLNDLDFSEDGELLGRTERISEDTDVELSDVDEAETLENYIKAALASRGVTDIEIIKSVSSIDTTAEKEELDGTLITGKYNGYLFEVEASDVEFTVNLLSPVDRNVHFDTFDENSTNSFKELLDEVIPHNLSYADEFYGEYESGKFNDTIEEDVEVELTELGDSDIEQQIINKLESYGLTNIKILQPIVDLNSYSSDFNADDIIIEGKYEDYILKIAPLFSPARSGNCEFFIFFDYSDLYCDYLTRLRRSILDYVDCNLSSIINVKIPEIINSIKDRGLTEDVEIEFEQTPGYQYKDITMQIANKLTDLGITDLQFYQPIYEDRFNALWFDDGTICTGRYKEFGVCIGAYARYMDIRFGDEDDETIIKSIQDLEDLEIFNDEGYYELYDCGSYEIYDEPELYFQIYDPANESELLNSAEDQSIYELSEIIDDAIPGMIEYLEENIDEFKGYLTKPVEEDLEIELSEIPEENKSLEIKLANYQVHTFWTIFCEDGIYPAMDYLESKGYKVDDYYKNEPQDSDLLDYFYDWIKENFESKTFKVFEKCRDDEDWLAEGIEWEHDDYIQFEPDTLYFEVKDIIRPLPEVLYHGTSEANAERIKETGGLALGQTSNWSASREDAIYLTTSKDDAYEYCNRVGLDNITILEIPVSALDLNKLYVDPNEEYYGEEDEDGKFYWDVFNFEYRDQISIDNIKFIEKNGYKLTEALSHNILFHRTTPTLAANILNDNELKVGGNYLFNLNRGKCICFSRDYNFIKNMSKQSNVVFVFNKDKLQTKYKLEPVSDTKNTGNNRARYTNNSKAEEVCFENITNVKDYLYKVVVSDAIYDSWLKFLEENGVEVDRSIFVKASDYRVNEELNNCRSKHSKTLTEELVDLSKIEVYSFGDKKWNATSQELLDLAVEAGAPVDTSTEPEKRIISLENFDVFYPFEEYDLDENFHLYCLIGVIDEMEEAGIPFEYFDEEEEGTPNEYCIVDMLDLVQYGEDSGYDATVIPFEGQYVIYLHNDKPSDIGAIEITEDVDEPEIEFSQIEIPQFTDITNKYKQLFESYGFTDIKFNKPIFEERQLALWYYDNNEPLVTMKYKDRYEVALVVDEMYYMHVNGGGWVKDVAEFEGEGLYTDKDIIDHTAYYEDSNETTIFEYEVDSRFWFRVHDSQNNNREIDNWFWIERCDDVWELAELNNALDDFDEFIKIYEEENGELLTVTEEVDNIELTNINPLEISDYVDTVDKLFQSVGHTPVYFPRTNDWGLKDETGQITWTGMSANSVIDMFEGEIDWLMEDWFDELDTYGLADKVPAARDEIYNWDEFLEVFGDKSIYNTPELKDFYDSHKFNIDAIDFMVNGREDFNLMLVPHDTDYDEYLDVELINDEEEE